MRPWEKRRIASRISRHFKGFRQYLAPQPVKQLPVYINPVEFAIASDQVCWSSCGYSSDLHGINATVPQGHVLFITLFLFRINDLLTLYIFGMVTCQMPVLTRNRSGVNLSLKEASDWRDVNRVRFKGPNTGVSFLYKTPSHFSCPCRDRLELFGLDPNVNNGRYIENLAKTDILFRVRRNFTPQQLLYFHSFKICIKYNMGHVHYDTILSYNKKLTVKYFMVIKMTLSNRALLSEADERVKCADAEWR